jgi:dihydrofolate reductase
MRRVRYNVAASLDGYIAGPNGEFDWIPDDPAVDFTELFAGVDTVLLGRHSYEVVRQSGPPPWESGARVYVFSAQLKQSDHPGVTVVGSDAADVVRALRAESGCGEIWLFGGGRLFASLLQAGQVDTVEVTLVPVLLGGGIPLVPRGVPRTALELAGTKTYPGGMVTLSYDVTREPRLAHPHRSGS